MSEMIERVAKAINAASESRHLPDELEAMARAAIAAMREPTERAVVAGCRALNHCPDDLMAAALSPDRHLMARTKMRNRWRAMIDEALK